jgi:hypothetical protein
MACEPLDEDEDDSTSDALEGNSLCTADSTCSSQPPPEPPYLKICADWLADSACGPLFQRYRECYIREERCDANGQQEISETVKACAAETAAWKNCARVP